MNKTIAAVIVVAILIGAGCAAFFISKSGNKGNDDTKLELFDPNVEAVLEAYGNVNEDCVIDAEDALALTQALEMGIADQYKYADANFDGTVNSQDVEYIHKIINATFENPVKVKHINRYTEGDYYAVGEFPINSVAISASANVLTMFKHIGVLNQIKAVAFYSGVEEVLLSEYQYLFCDKGKFDPASETVYRVGGSAGYFAQESLVKHITSDGVKAVITADNSKTYLAGPSSSYPYGMTEKEVLDLGLSVVRIAPASPDFTVFLSDMSMLCLVFGLSTDQIEKITTWLTQQIMALNSKLTDKIGADKTKQISTAVSSSCSYTEKDGKISTYNYVSSRTSDYTGAILAGGAKFAMDGYDFKGSSSSQKYEDLGKWLNDYPVEAIVIVKTGSDFSWFKGEASTSDTVKGCAKAFTDSRAYYDGKVYVICGDLPVFLRAIYTAAALYPGIFGQGGQAENWANQILASYMSEILGMEKSSYEHGKYFVTMEDLGLK